MKTIKIAFLYLASLQACSGASSQPAHATLVRDRADPATNNVLIPNKDAPQRQQTARMLKKSLRLARRRAETIIIASESANTMLGGDVPGAKSGKANAKTAVDIVLAQNMEDMNGTPDNGSSGGKSGKEHSKRVSGTENSVTQHMAAGGTPSTGKKGRKESGSKKPGDDIDVDVTVLTQNIDAAGTVSTTFDFDVNDFNVDEDLSASETGFMSLRTSEIQQSMSMSLIEGVVESSTMGVATFTETNSKSGKEKGKRASVTDASESVITQQMIAADRSSSGARGDSQTIVRCVYRDSKPVCGKYNPASDAADQGSKKGTRGQERMKRMNAKEKKVPDMLQQQEEEEEEGRPDGGKKARTRTETNEKKRKPSQADTLLVQLQEQNDPQNGGKKKKERKQKREKKSRRGLPNP